MHMKAYVRIEKDSQQIEVKNMPMPAVGNGEVLVRVEAFGVGIHDRYFVSPDVDFPYIIGSEGAGVIEELGNGVTQWQTGDRISFSTVFQPKGGSWAEFCVVNQNTVYSLPDNITYSAGAAIPVAGKTCLECMRELNLKSGDTLFIAGASGAIGSLIIQLAVADGITVSASASEKNHQYMKDLGVTFTVDYNEINWKDKIIDWSNGGVTAALAIQPNTERDSLEVVKKDGKVITVSGYNETIESERGITIRQMQHTINTNDKMNELIQNVSEHKIKIIIEKEYTFDNALEALEKTESRHAQGKVVVNLKK